MSNQSKNTAPRFKRTLISSIIAMNVMGVNAYAAEEAKKDEIEIIQVTGTFRGNLESALNDKKSSNTIGDSISADDIGSLPALDMGEALQAVPGVQLNREGGRRESSVNLRGLPSGFALTTANGQTIATPVRNGSGSAYGAGNPFGAYNPAVFSGIKVVKSQSADMQEGGISGTIDQGLRGALSRKDSLSLTLGARYEDLADATNPEFILSGSKQIIEDVLAFNGTLAYSEQTFRQDLIKINAYDTISDKNFDLGTGNTGTFSEWKAAKGLADDAIVKMPGEYRQQSETNTGDRLSFSGGIEYKPMENLKLGANVIYTQRELDGSRLEQLEMRLDQKTVGITPLDAYPPRLTGEQGTGGEDVYALSGVDFNNARYYFDNRQDAQLQDSNAIILDAEYTLDNWVIDGALTLSSATNERNEVLLSSRINNSGVNGTVYTGEGDIGNFFFDMENASEAMDFDAATWNPKNAVANTALVGADNGLYMIITGNYEEVVSKNDAFEINAERIFDDGFLTSVKFGYRYAQSSQDSDYAKGSSVGVNPQGILTSDAITDPSYTSEQSFFGGEAPGFVTAADGWRSFDFNSMNAALINTIDINNVNPSKAGEEPVLTPMGYIQRGGRQADGYIFSSSLDTHALYAMANFEYEFGTRMLSGNFGGRYIDSSTESRAPVVTPDSDPNAVPEALYTDNYSHFLPSVNMAMNLDEDDNLILRFAYNQSLVRPDLRAASPTAQFKFIEGKEADVKLPGTDIQPFTADSYDLSLEWYNREGSAITVAVYQKEIANLFDAEGICDSAALEGTGVDLGALSYESDGTCITDGNDNLGNADLLLPGNEVKMAGIVNIEDTMTVSGLEISLQQNLDFLPYPWNGLGGVVNFSKTKQDESNEVRVPGISDTSYNVIGYYEQDDYGLRLAYNHRTAYDLRTTGTANGSGDRSVAARGQLDASLYWNIMDDLKVSFKAYNLTDNLYEEYQNNEWQPRTTKYSGRVYAASIKYTFM